MNYTVYKTTNEITGKVYIGVHVTDNPDDTYLGSGKGLLRAIKRYGRDAFTKTILHCFDSYEEMVEMEATLVNSEFVSKRSNYNMVVGGGYPPSCKGKKPTEQHRKRISEALKGRVISEETRRKLSVANTGYKPTAEAIRKAGDSHRGKPLSAEHKRKLSERQLGDKNHMFGKHQTPESNQKRAMTMKIAAVKREDVSCPYCNTIGAKAPMNRWHFNNCKRKPRNT